MNSVLIIDDDKELCSLSTCVEGMSAVCMRWASSNVSGSGVGLVVQTLLSAVLLYLFWRGLRLAGWRYRALQAITPAQATAFLLPCGFIFWAVRFGFGLNRTDLAESSYPLTGISTPEAMGIVVCAAAALWALLTSFEGAVALREQKQRAETLCCRLEIQKQYAAEVQQKEEHLRSIQHDMDNHLIVLLGLLSQGRCQEAHEYTQTLKDAASGMRRQEAARHRAAMGPPTYVRPSKAAQGLAPVQHPALAVLLCAKIEWAQKQQIGISCQVSLPQEISIDEMDICTVVANGLDNAIKECGRVKQRGRRTPHIDMFMGLRGHFVLVEITNTAVSSKALVPGTGLGNIRRTAEKYQGTMETAQENGCFRLSVLLCTDC